MTIEKINVAQPITSTQNIAFKEEDTEQVTAKPSNNSKDVITLLSVLATLGAAGIAVYKHKNAKDAIKKAEEEAKKKVEEAENKAKKAAEDVEKKIQEAVDKAKEEFKKEKQPANNKPAGGSNKAPEKPNTKSPDESGSSPANTHSEKPKTQNKTPKKTSKILEGGRIDTDLDIVDVDLTSRIKESRNGIIVVPAITKLSEVVQKTTDSIKESYKKLINKIKHKPEKPITEPKSKAPNEKTASEKKESIINKTISYFKNWKNKFTVNKKAETKAETTKEKTPRFSVIKKTKEYVNKKYLDIKNYFNSIAAKRRIKKYFSEDANQGINYLQKEKTKIKSKIFVSDKMNDIWLRKQHDIKEKEYQKLFEEYFDKQFKDIPDADLLKEYSALKDIVKDLPVSDYKTERFLEIQAELMNHRGYIFNNGKLVKSVRSFYDEGAEKGLYQLGLEEDVARFKKTASNIKNENWLQEQKTKKEQEYKKLFDEHFDKQLKKASDLDLLVEYHVLKRIIKNRPVMDPDVLRFLEIQGELVNHRGYKVKPDGKIINLSVANDNRSFIDKIKSFFKF